MDGEGSEAFRAVIRIRYPNGEAVTRVAGPYGTVSAARAAVTRNARHAARYSGARAEGHVEKAGKWERV